MTVPWLVPDPDDSAPSRGERRPPVWQSVHGAYHALRILVQERLPDLCLEASEAFVLVYLLTDAGCSPAQVRHRLGFHRSTLSSLLTRLEVRGYVRRGPGPYDARRTMVDLTPTGRRVAERVRDVLADVEADLDAWVTPRDRRGADAVFASCVALIMGEGGFDL